MLQNQKNRVYNNILINIVPLQPKQERYEKI